MSLTLEDSTTNIRHNCPLDAFRREESLTAVKACFRRMRRRANDLLAARVFRTQCKITVDLGSTNFNCIFFKF